MDVHPKATVFCFISRVARKGMNYNETSIKEYLFQHMVVKVKNIITRGRSKIEMYFALWISFLLRELEGVFPCLLRFMFLCFMFCVFLTPKNGSRNTTDPP